MAPASALQAMLQSTCAHLGESFTQVTSTQWRTPSGRLLFAKLTTPVEQVLGEAASLKAMDNALKKAYKSEEGGSRADSGDTDESAWSLVPTVHAYGKSEDGRAAYLVTDYKDMSGRLGADAQRALGTKLALMHKHGTSENGKYGFDVPTFCGDTKQDNTWEERWSTFWADRRIGDIVQRIGAPSLRKLEAELREAVYPLLLAPLDGDSRVRPAILHGDLWSGNAGAERDSGAPVIFDPSSYYGHNEAELGMMRMFGGFTPAFFEAYHAVLPRCEPHYEQRQRLYELYHHLNHALLFGGGGYQSGAETIMRELVQWARQQGGAHKSEL